MCALTKDFQQLPQGDMTIIGDRGASLSGGQRARVNLARAVYRQADIYLLDDPLSAVDTHVAKHLYKKCITMYLAGKTRVLVTHQLQFLKKADHIIVLDRVCVILSAFPSQLKHQLHYYIVNSTKLSYFIVKGFIKIQGSYNELVESNKDFIEMMDELSDQMQKEEEEAKRISQMSIKKVSLMKRPSIVSTRSSIAVKHNDYLIC